MSRQGLARTVLLVAVPVLCFCLAASASASSALGSYILDGSGGPVANRVASSGSETNGTTLLFGFTGGNPLSWARSFVVTTVGVSQLKSLLQLITLNPKGAVQTQLEFFQRIGGFGDRIPVLGHAKGIALILLGQREAGIRAIQVATKSLGIFLGTALGAFVVGPLLGAMVGFAVGGFGADILNTAVATFIEGRGPNGEFRFAGWLGILSTMRRQGGIPGFMVNAPLVILETIMDHFASMIQAIG